MLCALKDNDDYDEEAQWHFGLDSSLSSPSRSLPLTISGLSDHKDRR